MKLKKEFIHHDTKDGSLLVPGGQAGWYGVVKGNKTLGIMLDLLKEETTEEELVAAVRARFDAPEGAVAADAAKLINELRNIGALDE